MLAYAAWLAGPHAPYQKLRTIPDVLTSTNALTGRFRETIVPSQQAVRSVLKRTGLRRRLKQIAAPEIGISYFYSKGGPDARGNFLYILVLTVAFGTRIVLGLSALGGKSTLCVAQKQR